MSIVGPRAERPDFVFVLSKIVPGYSDRHLIPPGITGLARLSLPPDSGLDSVRRKPAIDLTYVHRACLLLDVQLLLCTCLYMVGIRGPLAGRVCGLRGCIDSMSA